MTDLRVDYDRVANTYHRRYAVNSLPGVTAALQTLVDQIGATYVLEVGCGTGRWLAELQSQCNHICGVDQSFGMLKQARERHQPRKLVCARAGALPFASASCDLVFCVNAFHHFQQPENFIAEARRLLRPGGRLAIVGMNPGGGRDRWYLYEYFEGLYEVDLARYPSAGAILDLLVAAGFGEVTWQTVEHIRAEQVGRAVLTDYFLQKNSTSQLILLTDEAYAAGLRRIKTAIVEAEARREPVVFLTDLFLDIVIGRA